MSQFGESGIFECMSSSAVNNSIKLRVANHLVYISGSLWKHYLL